ncbi:MAG: elongation factor Ts [Patescibacteria group bacterium]|nr:elongation factor Ts [Patescibacteria group bacterium]
MDTIKQLREETGLSFSQIKKALDEVGGDVEKAREKLKEMSASQAEKKADREIAAGAIGSYVHNTRIMGAQVVLGCETDFVAKNPEFVILADNIAMHAAAMNPESIEEMLAQAYVKDGEVTVQELINQHIQKFGENLKLVQMNRFSI